MKTLYEMQLANREFFNGYKRLNHMQTNIRKMFAMEEAIKDGTYYW